MENLGVVEKNDLIKTNQQKKELDRHSILELAGKFHVTFDFIETFSPLKDYKREELYKVDSIEYIFPIKDEENFISLQHILVINDKFVVKHWRQDWIYENQDFLVFDKEGIWKKKQLSADEVKGTWTQKVYQVDDCPRYQGLGTWVYVDGKRYWETEVDAPLPRRQETRTDYNVLHRNSRIELTDYGWLMDQDNQKIFRNEKGEDQLIAWEKGFEIQNRGDYDIQPAIDYWKETENYWEVVRAIWAEIIENTDGLKVHEKIDGTHLYDKVFGLAKEFSGDKFDKEIVKSAVKATIESHRF